MKYRCKNENRKYYNSIDYCSRWENFKNFFADMGKRPENKTLDRIDNNGDYCEENCRWATAKQQAINRRNTHLFEYKGIKMTLTDWSYLLGIKRSTLAQRIYVYKWSLDKALQKGGYQIGK